MIGFGGAGADVRQAAIHIEHGQAVAGDGAQGLGASGNFLINTNNPYLSPQMQEVVRQLDLRETGTTRITTGTQTLSTVAGDGLAVLNLNRLANGWLASSGTRASP